ncbi:hypothetical protein B0H15DRAFT_956401 [Mycena belliarum]|uniref:DUF6532 domain-containing protein n=1 Tax=Mycena belliarum TaxID=1033014 RepID=A0AAD6XJC5_9AGAR|nr:hypothetical protein B0H15DRAFT_956401 [Mycena belliae]
MSRAARGRSDSDSDGGALDAQTARVRRSRDDLSGNEILPTRTRTARDRQPTEKQSAKNKENLEVMQQQMAKMAKELEKAERKLRQQSARKPLADEDDDGVESEDRDAGDFDDPQEIRFQSSSIQPLAVLPLEGPRRTERLTVSKASRQRGPPKTSSRAFLQLPPVDPPSPTGSVHRPDSSPHERDNDGDPAEDGWRSSSPLDGRVASGAAPPRPSGRNGPRSSSPASSAPPRDTSRNDPPTRGRTTTGSSSAGEKRKQAASSSSPAPPHKRKHKEPRLQEPRFAEGYSATSGAKPKASDYEPMVCALLLRAMAEYALQILTVNGFPPAGLQTMWADRSFKSACKAANQHYVLTERMNKLANHEARVAYPGADPVVSSNRAISAHLIKDQAFHYKDPQARTGFGGNSILGEMRHLTTFKNKNSLGALHTARFTPYPLELLALEFTGIEFCALEWSTGVYVAAQFFEKDVLKIYSKHLLKIQQWSKLNEHVVENIRRKWSSRASRSLNLTSPDEDDGCLAPAQEDALREELEGRTGATDSEAESDVAPPAEMGDAAMDMDITRLLSCLPLSHFRIAWENFTMVKTYVWYQTVDSAVSAT